MLANTFCSRETLVIILNIFTDCLEQIPQCNQFPNHASHLFCLPHLLHSSPATCLGHKQALVPYFVPRRHASMRSQLLSLMPVRKGSMLTRLIYRQNNVESLGQLLQTTGIPKRLPAEVNTLNCFKDRGTSNMNTEKEGEEHVF